jgi:hypothetical protein
VRSLQLRPRNRPPSINPDRAEHLPKYVVSSTLDNLEWNFPVVLGAGERLLGETSDKKPMRLAASRTVDESVAVLAYERVQRTWRAQGADSIPSDLRRMNPQDSVSTDPPGSARGGGHRFACGAERDSRLGPLIAGRLG